MFEKDDGMAPVNMFLLRNSICRFGRVPSHSGTALVN
jgi:hypothetical protein